MNMSLFGKKLNLLLLASLIAVMLFACGGGDEAPMDAPPPPPPPTGPPPPPPSGLGVPKVIKPFTMKKSSKEEKKEVEHTVSVKKKVDVDAIVSKAIKRGVEEMESTIH